MSTLGIRGDFGLDFGVGGDFGLDSGYGGPGITTPTQSAWGSPEPDKTGWGGIAQAAGSAAIEAGGTIAAGLMQSAATDRARRASEDIYNQTLESDSRYARQREQLGEVSGAMKKRGMEQGEREQSLAERHANFIRKVQDELRKGEAVRRAADKYVQAGMRDNAIFAKTIRNWS